MMEKQKRVFIVLSLCLIVLMLWSGCNGSSSSPSSPNGNILVDQDVTVPGGGGSADVTFSANSGQTIRMTLRASDTSLEPYGYLTSPDGAGEYTPPNGASQNGENSSDVTLNQSGTFTLTVFDSTNQGGTIHVTVEVL